MRKWTVASLTLALLLAPFVASPAAVATTTGPQPADGEMRDVEWYADHYGVTLEEATTRLALEDDAGELDAVLESREPSFAGLWIEHTPQFRVVAAFTSSTGEEILRRYVDGTQLMEVAEATTATFTMAELQRHQQQVMSLHRSFKGAEDFESQINVKTNRLEILTATREARDAMNRSRDDLPPSAVLIEVPGLSQPGENIYGGLFLSTCTSGFAVEKDNTTTRGVSTAGHCGNTQSYLGTDLPWQNGQYSGNTDAQWHTAPGFTKKNWVRDGLSDSTTPYYRVISGRKHRDNQSVGSTVCKYGAYATGYGCGTLENKTYDPGDNCVPGSGNTWMRVEGNGTRLMADGDSGGPVFLDSVAYGTMSCHYGTGDDDMVYMAQNYFNNIGVHVWLGS